MGPKVLVPSVSAGGAEADPFPSMPSRTLGENFLKPSAQSATRLFIVSEPTHLSVPETSPETFL